MRENEQNHPAVPEEKPRPVEDTRRQSIRAVVWAAGGIYLLYLVFQLAKGVIEGTVDRTGRIVSICACVLFTAAAVVMLVAAIRQGVRAFRASVDAMTAVPDDDEDEDAEEEEEEDAEDAPRSLPAPEEDTAEDEETE